MVIRRYLPSSRAFLTFCCDSLVAAIRLEFIILGATEPDHHATEQAQEEEETNSSDRLCQKLYFQ